jgi:hypothetical protein
MNSDKNMRDEIQRVAYGLYEKRGYVPGKDLLDWLEAEKIVREKNFKEMRGELKTVKTTKPRMAMESAILRSQVLFAKPAVRQSRVLESAGDAFPKRISKKKSASGSVLVF